MRILHVGNAEAFKNLEICRYFLERGYEIHYFSPFAPKKRLEGMRYHYPEKKIRTKVGILLNVLLLKRIVRRVKPALVHAHNVYGYGWIAALARCSPLVIHAYGGDILPEQMQNIKCYQFILSKYAIRKADRLIVTGQHMISAVADNFGANKDKIKLLSRGVDLEVFQPFSLTKKESLKAKYGIGTGDFVLLSPRYLFNSVYNIDIILKAVSRLKEEFPEILLFQMHNHKEGEPCFRQMIELIKEWGIEDRVRILRMVPMQQMAEIYNLADICISVPSSDGFPVTVLEASACKVPLIVSDLSYTKEWFECGKNGLVVKKGDDKALALAIGALAKDYEKRRRFAEINFKKVHMQGDYRKCMAELEKIYQEVAEK